MLAAAGAAEAFTWSLHTRDKIAGARAARRYLHSEGEGDYLRKSLHDADATGRGSSGQAELWRCRAHP